MSPAGKASGFRQLIQIALPIIASQVGTVLMGFTDTLFIGQLGKVELAAGGVANAVFFITAILGLGIMMAASAFTANLQGAGHQHKLRALFRAVQWVAVCTGLLLGAAVWLFAANFHWFRQPPDVGRQAGNFLGILSLSLVPLLLFVGIKSFFDGSKNTLPGLVITLAGLAANALLNWLLIGGNWGLPALGFEGSAWATLITRLLMVAAFYLYYHYSASNAGVRQQPGGSEKLALPLLRLGLPSGLQFQFEAGAFAGAALLMGWLGKEAGAAHVIAIQLASVTYMAATGISTAGSIQVGNAAGSGNALQMKLAGRTALASILGFMALCGMVLVLFRYQLIGWFAADPQVTEIAAELLIIAGLFQLSDGLQCVGLGILRGIGDTKFPTVITLLAYWVIGLPGAWLLGFTLKMGPVGVWLALLAGLSFAAIALNYRFFRLVKSSLP